VDAQLLEIIDLCLRAVFVVGLPVVIVAAVAGTVVSLIQGAMSISDSGLQYAARVVAVGVALIVLWPTAVRYLSLILERALE